MKARLLHVVKSRLRFVSTAVTKTCIPVWQWLSPDRLNMTVEKESGLLWRKILLDEGIINIQTDNDALAVINAKTESVGMF